MSDEPWNERDTGGDDRPWREPDDEGWQFPRSLAEVRERWHSDSTLRLILGNAAITAIAAFFLCSGLRWA